MYTAPLAATAEFGDAPAAPITRSCFPSPSASHTASADRRAPAWPPLTTRSGAAVARSTVVVSRRTGPCCSVIAIATWACPPAGSEPVPLPPAIRLPPASNARASARTVRVSRLPVATRNDTLLPIA